jgi:hypothetical protein
VLVAEDHQGHPDLLSLDLATDTIVWHVREKYHHRDLSGRHPQLGESYNARRDSMRKPCWQPGGDS